MQNHDVPAGNINMGLKRKASFLADLQLEPQIHGTKDHNQKNDCGKNLFSHSLHALHGNGHVTLEIHDNQSDGPGKDRV